MLSNRYQCLCILKSIPKIKCVYINLLICLSPLIASLVWFSLCRVQHVWRHSKLLSWLFFHQWNELYCCSVRHRLLQSYIQSSVKDGEVGPEINTWEQGRHLHVQRDTCKTSDMWFSRFNLSFFLCVVSEVFFLFGLYDYDRSGLLDGLEMMKLLSDYNSHRTPGAQADEQVRRSGCSARVFELQHQLNLFILPEVHVFVFWLQVVSMVDFLLQTQDLNQDGLLAPSELLSPALPHSQVLYMFTFIIYTCIQ